MPVAPVAPAVPPPVAAAVPSDFLPNAAPAEPALDAVFAVAPPAVAGAVSFPAAAGSSVPSIPAGTFPVEAICWPICNITVSDCFFVKTVVGSPAATPAFAKYADGSTENLVKKSVRS